MVKDLIKQLSLAVTVLLGVVAHSACNTQTQDLWTAARAGDVNTVKRLLSRVDDVNLLDPRRNRTLLHEAAAFGQDSIVSVLLEKGAVPDSVDRLGNTPMLEAARNGHASTVRLLMRSGANPCIQNKNGFSGLHLAGKNADVVYLLLKAGCNVNCTNTELRTPLINLMWAGSYKAGGYASAKLLIDGGARLDEIDFKGWTALMAASWLGDDTMVALLTARGANQSVVTKEGKTAFRLADDQGHSAVVKLLRKE